MPDLRFRVTGVEAAARGLTPLLHFKLEITAPSPSETIHAVILQTQIQIQSPQRSYSASEKEKLGDLFGTPDRWGQTLRNKLWAHASVSVSQFTGSVTAILPVPSSFDLNIAATKYFHAIENGEVPLLFLFSGSVFYTGPGGGLQVERISWDKECVFRMPIDVWRGMMDEHYPNTAWIYLHRDVFAQFEAFKRRHGLATWEQAIERLLSELESEGVARP